MDFSFLKNIVENLSSVISAVVFLFTAVLFIINKIKKKRSKLDAEEQAENLQEALTEKEARYALVSEIIPAAMMLVENMPNIDGATKKMLALSRILLDCNSRGIDYDKFGDFIGLQIEEVINLSKNLNARSATSTALNATQESRQ